MKQIELTSKLVLAIIALTSVSAILVPTYAAPSIRSADIVNGEVKTDDLANGAVTSPKISDTNGVRSADIVNGEVKAEDIADGALPSGGVHDLHRVDGVGISIPAGTLAGTDVDCAPGEILTGGGFSLGTGTTIVYTSVPLDENTWRVVAAGTDNIDGIDGSAKAVAVCGVPSP